MQDHDGTLSLHNDRVRPDNDRGYIDGASQREIRGELRGS